MRIALAAGLFLILLTPVASVAAEKPDDCGGQVVPPPADLSPWAAIAPDGVMAAAAVGEAPELKPGQVAELTLRPQAQVHFATPPGKVGTSDGFAGLFAFDVVRPGTWRVALGKAAWVDVVKDGVSIASTNHGHGPACTGIRKIVEFPLTPGRYLLQLAASPGDRVTALILPPA